jgi:hypothetical protein
VLGAAAQPVHRALAGIMTPNSGCAAALRRSATSSRPSRWRVPRGFAGFLVAVKDGFVIRKCFPARVGRGAADADPGGMGCLSGAVLGAFTFALLHYSFQWTPCSEISPGTGSCCWALPSSFRWR